MDRIHRLGQRRPVQAIKLIIEDRHRKSHRTATREEVGDGGRHTLHRRLGGCFTGTRAKIADSHGTLGDGRLTPEDVRSALPATVLY